MGTMAFTKKTGPHKIILTLEIQSEQWPIHQEAYHHAYLVQTFMPSQHLAPLHQEFFVHLTVLPQLNRPYH